jgi:nitroreductase
MDVFTAIETRRSVKAYDPNFVMPEADRRKLLDTVRHAPTSFNMQNWRFVVVSDPTLRAAIQQAAYGQLQVVEASLLLVLCADLKAWDKSPERYWTEAPKPVQDALVPMIKPFYQGRDTVQRDEAMRSVGIAAQTLMLAAKAMGYDSCPMIGFDAEAVGKLINLPADHTVGMLLVIGKALKPAYPKGGFLPQADIVVENKFM